MPNPARILVYGRDPSLLETRQLVLRTLGGTVLATTDVEFARSILTQEVPHLLVLCYALSPEERAAILDSVEQLPRKLKVLILRADGPATIQTDDNFSIFSGTAALKSKVMEMLGAA
jgi:DNA-binding response OmpR family regulator